MSRDPQSPYAHPGLRWWLVAAVVGLAGLVAPAGLRPLNTDRPDSTESPFTVDAGHTQLEMDFANYTSNHLAGIRTTEWGLAPFNLRYGLRPDIEAGLFVIPYLHRTLTLPDGSELQQAGMGDLTLRAKFNFWGNDGGATAFGLIVDGVLPIAAHGLGSGSLAGDLILPVAFELPGGWDLGAMTKLNLLHRDNGGFGPVWENSATLGHDITGAVSGFVELTSAAGDGAHVATFDFGFLWKTDANTQFDVGANIGISHTADHLEVFSGISRRF